VKMGGKSLATKIPDGPGPGAYLCPDSLFTTSKTESRMSKAPKI
jgi:hypothetical protein